MADLENPGVGELAADVTPQRDGNQSPCGIQLCMACMIGAFMEVCVIPAVFYYLAHRTAGPGIQVLAGFLLALGFSISETRRRCRRGHGEYSRAYCMHIPYDRT
ncbi:unnamed protein product [Urochloa humidicola]